MFGFFQSIGSRRGPIKPRLRYLVAAGSGPDRPAPAECPSHDPTFVMEARPPVVQTISYSPVAAADATAYDSYAAVSPSLPVNSAAAGPAQHRSSEPTRQQDLDRGSLSMPPAYNSFSSGSQAPQGESAVRALASRYGEG